MTCLLCYHEIVPEDNRCNCEEAKLRVEVAVLKLGNARGQEYNQKLQAATDKLLDERERHLKIIATLKDLLGRFVSYELDEYEMKIEDVEGDCPVGLFEKGYWNTLKEIREALK